MGLPYISSYLDRHGKRRWRFRRGSRTAPLPSPDDPGFPAAYEAALAGRPIIKALRYAIAPRSLRAAWQILINDTPEWRALDPETRHAQTLIAERFLMSPLHASDARTWGDVAVSDLRRRHIKALLAQRSGTPHAASHLLRLLRKLTGIALDHEWIEDDPTYRIRWRPPYKGHQAWPAGTRTAFEERWPLGTTARTAYALALYFGHRRSDVAKIRWSDLGEDGADMIQKKTGKRMWLPILPPLANALSAIQRKGETILVTRYGEPFSGKALGMRMQEWTRAAGIPPGYTFHGLRKSLGAVLAERGATTREIMAILGHDAIEHAELYTRSAEQKLLASSGMGKLRDRPG